nr:MAG TPA: hypothetical protein [Bacteriophage sp.]
MADSVLPLLIYLHLNLSAFRLWLKPNLQKLR